MNYIKINLKNHIFVNQQGNINKFRMEWSKMEDLCHIYTLIGSEFGLKDIYIECIGQIIIYVYFMKRN